jgi:fructokinase
MASAQGFFAGVELGGTKCVALTARGREIVAVTRLPTREPQATLAALADWIEEQVRGQGMPEAIGIASFGPLGLDPARPGYGRITSTPKPGWADVDVAGYFADRFALPVAFDTDVAGAALAEYRWGAARGCDVTVYLTVGTGIGAGILVDGKPLHGLIHPEFGHIRVRRQTLDDFRGVCPFHGDCLEGLVSGPAIAARAGRPGMDVDDDDPLWGWIMAEMAEALAMLMVSLSPMRILIGGGVFQQRPKLFHAIRRRTAALLNGYLAGIGERELATIIVPPGLGEWAGPLGAIALAGTEARFRPSQARA